MSPVRVRRLAVIAASLTAAGVAVVAVPMAFANSAGTDLVISEAYVNGGSSGASYLNKFVELYNPTSAAIDLTGKTLQYRAPTSTVTPSGQQVFALTGAVAAHGHFLIQLPSNNASSNPGAPLPTADLSTGTSINPGAGGGTLFVAASATGVLPTDAAVIDKIGWGTSNSPEGTAASGNSLTLSYQRDATGTDTDTNATDFSAAAPVPQNSLSDGPGPEPTPTPTPSPSDGPGGPAGGVVINEVYGGGGNSGATYINDFIELYNPTAQDVSLAGWSVQYRSANGTSAQVTGLTGTIHAGGYYLVQEAAGTGGTTALPTPDASGSIPLSATAGVVILSDGTTGIAAQGNLVGVAGVVDAVGFGTATSFEAAAAPGLSNTTSAARTNGSDTNNNAVDFTAGTPTPQSSGSGGNTGGDGGTHTIAEIQGTTDVSPFAGQTVTTEGIVTADYVTGGFNGFYLQTAGTGAGVDATPGASDGIYVFGSISAAQVHTGDSVRVTGVVSEFQGLTEIGSPTVTALPAALAPVTPAVIAWSDLDTDPEKEAHEGELIAPQGTFTVSDNFDTNWYGSFTLAYGDTPLRQPTDAAPAGSPAAYAVAADNAARMVTLDDGSSFNYSNSANTGTALPWLTPTNPARVGSTVTFHAPVILDYRFSLWNFQPTAQVVDDGAAVATFSDTRATNQQPVAVGGQTRLASFNVENFFTTTGEAFVGAGLGTCSYYTDRAGNRIAVNTCTTTGGGAGPRGAANDANLQRQLAKIVTGINRLGASVVSLEEVENSAQFGQPRDTALAALVTALNTAAGSTVWAYVPSPAASALPPLADQDVIRTAFIYQPAVVTPVGGSTVLTGTQSFSIAREPLAQAFKKVGTRDVDSFLVVANHFKSKGTGTPLYDGDAEDTSSPAVDQGAFNATRVHEAQDVVAFAAQVAATVGTERIFLVGDLNAYTQEDPMQVLYSAGYVDLGSTDDPGEASYSFNSLAGSLDHVLANPAALAMVTGADVWQINAQEAIAYAYSRYNYNATLLFDGTDPFAASDHDPVVVGLVLPAPPPLPGWNASAIYISGDLVSYNGSTWRALWWTQNQRPGDPYGPWEEIRTDTDGTAIWTPTRIFLAGDVVRYDGHTYRAQWWTRAQPPGIPWGPWQVIG